MYLFIFTPVTIKKEAEWGLWDDAQLWNTEKNPDCC